MSNLRPDQLSGVTGISDNDILISEINPDSDLRKVVKIKKIDLLSGINFGNTGDFISKDQTGNFVTKSEIINFNSDDVSYFSFLSRVENNSGQVQNFHYDTPSEDIYLSGSQVDSAESLKVYLRWDGPGGSYMGSASIDGIEIPKDQIIELGNSTRRFEGYLDNLNLTGQNFISGEANGFSSIVSLVELGGGTTPDSVIIDDISHGTPKPNTNLGISDMKGGDQINIFVTFPSPDVGGIKIYNSGISNGSDYSSYPLSDTGDGNYTATIPVLINSSRNGSQGVCVVAKNNFGTIGNDICSINNISLDQNYPNINISSISYPSDQQALKNSESSIVNHTINDYDSVNYQSQNGELSIQNTSSFNQAKPCQRVNGSYNLYNDNFKVSAFKNSNGAVSSSSCVVKIANTPMTLNISNLSSNLQSSPLGLDDNFNLTSNQLFLSPPFLSTDSSQIPPSQLSTTNSGANTNSNNFLIKVKDSDLKGLFSWQVSGKNTAGIITSVLSSSPNYNIKGFSPRTISSNPSTALGRGLFDIGVGVSDPNDVVFENIAEGGSGPNGGTIYSYKTFNQGAQLEDSMDFNNKFTICDSSGIVSLTGDHAYNLDKTIRDANASTAVPATANLREE